MELKLLPSLSRGALEGKDGLRLKESSLTAGNWRRMLLSFHLNPGLGMRSSVLRRFFCTKAYTASRNSSACTGVLLPFDLAALEPHTALHLNVIYYQKCRLCAGLEKRELTLE